MLRDGVCLGHNFKQFHDYHTEPPWEFPQTLLHYLSVLCYIILFLILC